MHTGDTGREEKDLNNLHDNVLTAELARGRNAAATVLVQRYGLMVFRIARWILKNNDEAEETVQMVFLEAFRDISHFDAKKGTFSAWLRRLAVYRSMDRRKHLQAQGFYSWREIDDEITDQLLSETEPELLHIINELVDKLEPSERVAISLTFYQGLTAKEVAAETGLSLSKVQRTLRRALDKLRLAFPAATERRR